MAKDYKKMLQQAGFGAQDSTEQDEQKKKSGAKDYAEMLRKAGFGANGSAQKDDGLDDAQRAARERMIALRKYENDQRNYTNGGGLNTNGLDKAQQAARNTMVWARKPEVQQHLQARANELQKRKQLRATIESTPRSQSAMSGASMSQSLAQNIPNQYAPMDKNTLPKSLSNKPVEQKGALEYISEKGDEALYNAVQSRNQTMEAVSQALLGFFEGMSSKKKAKFKAYSPNLEEDTPKRELTRATEKFSRAMENANDRMTDTMEYNRVNYPSVSTTDTAPEYENVRNKPVARFAGDANATMAGMIPRYISAVTASGIGVSGLPGIAGGMTSAAQTFQNAYNEARNDGADEQSATLFAAANASTDAIIESFTGGVLEGGAGIADSVVQKYAGNALNNFFRSRPMMQTISYVVAKGVGEGTEEVLQDLSKTGAKKLIYGSDEKLDPKSLAYSGLLGFAMGSAFSAMEAPARYAVYKSDYNTVNTLSRGAGEVKSNADADAMEATADAIIDAADKAIDELQNAKPSEDVDTKEEISRLNYVKDGAQKVKDALNENRADIIEQNVAKEDATQNAVDGTPDTIIDDTAKLVNTVADTIEPDKNAVNATIDHVVQEIRNADVQESVAQTDVEKQEIAAKRSRLEEIDKTLRNNRQEVENARKDTKNQSDVPETGTKKTVREPIPPVYHEGKGVVQYFVPGRKTPVATSTQSDFNTLKLFGGNTTIKQAYDTPLMSAGNVKNILDAYISRGYGDVTLHDMFGFTGKNEFEANQNIPVPRNGNTENNSARTVEKTPEKNVQTEKEKPLTETTPDVTMEQEEAVKPEEQSVQPEETEKPETDAKKTGQFIVDGKVVELDTTEKAPTTKDFSLTHVVKKHTKTGEDMDVFQIPKNLSDAEYKTLKQKMKDVGGYYSSFVRGFIVPRDKAGSVSDFANVVEVAPAPKNDAETAIGSLDKGDKLPDSGVTLAKDADKYTDDHQRVMEEYASAVDKDFLDYLSVEVKNPGIQAKPYTVSRMSDKTAGMIKEKIGLDTTGWDVKIEPRMVDHIWKRHGENGEQDHSMADVSDIARIAYVLNDPDALDETDKSKAYRENHPYLDGKTRAARSVLITKKVNGTYYVVEAVPNSNRNAAFIVSAYMNKKGAISTADNSLVSPAQTSAGNDVNTLSENQTPATIPDHSNTSIAEKTENVNTKSPSSEISNYVLNQLSEGKKFTSQELQDAANKAYGGTMAEGKYDVKAMTDAMELGVNRYIIDTVSKAQSDFNAPEAKKAVESIDEITSDILSMIPTQTKRSEEQISLQQFSTPPNIAYLASWVANIDKSDTVLEPSAGIGGLASFAKADGAKVYVNELSESRLDMLKQLPFDGFFKENAEQIHNILPDSVSPSVVLMNPPFSSTGGRTKNSTKNAIPHIEQALLRLQDGGRLVAIVGKGMADDTPTFRNWYNELRKTYNIRANVGISGENYRKYGTTFDVQMLVIDKTGPQKSKTITGNYDDLREIPQLLEEVRNDRNRKDQQLGTGESGRTDVGNARGTSDTEVGVADSVPTDVSRHDSDVSLGVPGRRDAVSRTEGTDLPNRRDTISDTGDSKHTEVVQNDDGGVQRERTDTGVQERNAGTERVPAEESGRGRRSVENERSDHAGNNISGDGENPRHDVQNGRDRIGREDVTKKTAEKTSANSSEDNGTYASYVPEKLNIKGTKQHPSKLVESSAMASVHAPDLHYVPNLSRDIITNGLLSDAQLEAVMYAGQAHESKLPNGDRKGFLIGDGTGVGKGREISGIILDNFNSGRTKAVWVSMASGLVNDATRDWVDLGGNASDIIDFSKENNKKGGIGRFDRGIMFVTYDTLKSKKKTGETNVDKIADWFGRDFDGVIVFDEAHKMGNLIKVNNGQRGAQKPSQNAVEANKFQNALKNARVVYASATAADKVTGLAFASRLGLWGEGTQFADVEDFASKIGSSGMAAMELVARDMKATGAYMSRNLSYDGVGYDRLEHQLTDEQIYMYDTMSEGWQAVIQDVSKAARITGSNNRNAESQLWSSMMRFYDQVLVSMSMPSVISDIEKQLADGKACVVQVVNTQEAAQERAVEKMRSEGNEDYDTLDITPRQILDQYLINCFPVEQYEKYMDENGNESSRVARDSNGNPIINKQAVAMRDALRERINDISIPEGPIDMLINHFGKDKVAEVSGRERRFINAVDEHGNTRRIEDIRGDSTKSGHAVANQAEANAFQNGDKNILIFSAASGGTGFSFHADKRAKNNKQRVGYILQTAPNSQLLMQTIGRIHRSNELFPPIYKLVSTDLSAQKRYVTSSAKRLEQLGALTKGQRQASGGIFTADDNLETDISSDALLAFFDRLGHGKIPGLDPKRLLEKMGYSKYFYDEYGNFTLNKNVGSNITRFLNRILALGVKDGNRVFDEFMDIRQSYYEAAAEAGKIDTGMENVKADKLDIVQDETVYTDSSTGAETKYIQAKVFNKPTVIKTLEDAQAYKPQFQGLRRMEDGSVRAVYRIADQTNAFGLTQKRYRLQGANTVLYNTMNERNMDEKTEVIPKENWAKEWKEAIKDVPKYNESELHMITGALLPVWNKLPQDGNIKAMRITASDGTQYFGRIIPPKQIDAVLRGLGVKGTSVKKEYSGTDLYSAIMDKAQVAVFNGMYGGTLTVARRRVSGENRLEVSGGNLFSLKNKYPGVFSETIQYKTRYFIPSGDRGKEILADMAKDYGVRSLGQADDESTVFFSKVQSTWGSRDGKDGKLPKMKSVSDLYKEAKSIFGVEINTGKIGSANAEGIYNTHANTIRTRVYGDLPTIAHELGHMFDKKYNLNEAAEVDKLVEHYKNDLEAAGYNESLFRNEAIAMYFADMLRNSETAQQENPEFSRYLFETLSNEDRNKLGDYKQMTAQYYAADDRTRRGAQIHYRHKDNSAIGKAKFQVDLFSKNPRAYMNILGRQFVHYVIDDVASIGFAVGKENSRNALNLARRQRMADSIAAGRLKYAFTDNNGDVIGQSLQAVLSEGGINDKNARDFDAYLVARVALDRLETNADDKSVKTLVYADKSLGSMSALVDAIEEYERLNPTFHDAAEGVYEYKNNLLRIAVESGIIKEELAEHLKSTFPHYVPLYRVMDRDKPSYSGRGKKTPHSPIARFKGSGRDVYSPIENLIVQTVNFTKAIQQNEARKALFDVVDQKEDMGLWAEKVPESQVFDMIPTTDVSDKIKAFLTNDDLYTENLSDEQLGELYEDIMSYVGQYTGTWKRKQNQGDTVVSVMRNGSPHYYEIHDEVLLKALEALAPKQRNVVVNAFSVVTRTMSTLTTTVSPRFNLFTNPIRDAVNGFIFSKTTVNPVKYATDLASAFFDAIRESDDFKLYLARGGGYTGSVTSNMNVMRNMHQQLVQRTGFHPIAWFSDFLPDVSNAIESAPRYAEYKRSLAKGESNVEAIQKANEITVDFKQGGSATKYANNFVMFFNAQITSIIQNFKRLKDKKTLAKWLAANLLTAASWAVLGNLIYEALGIDKEEADEAYAQMSPYNKFSNELLYIGDGQFIRIPKDTSTMILNTLAKAMWEKEVLGNDNAFRGMGGMSGYLMDTFCPFWGSWNDISIFGTAFDLKENKTFTGAPIVPTAYQKQNPEMQYNEKTSAFSIRLGSWLGLSPMQIDYVIDDTMGYIGDLFLNLTKQGGPDWKSVFDVQKTSEKSILKGLPVPGVALRDSVYSTDIVNVFYDTKDKYNKAANGYNAGGEKYTFYDTYGSYKYDKIADVYTKVNKQIKATSDEVLKRDLRAELNAVLNSVNNTEKTKLDERIAELAQQVGCSASDIAPYIKIPDDVKTKNANGEKVTYVLSGYNMIDYFNASQVMLPLYCENIMNADATPEEKADALKKLKKEVKKYLDEQFVEYMSGR